MELETLEKAATSGYKKSALLCEQPAHYWLRSIMAGMYLSIVVLIYWSLSNNLHESPFGKVLASAFFGVGLSIIVFTNSELFTSNNMYLAISSGTGRTSWSGTARLWTVCWLGNLVGAVVLALLLLAAGALGELPADHALHAAALHKVHQSAVAIFCKGILANWVVCLAVWIALRVKEDITKIVAMILVVFMFLYLGFEHSIANMGIFAMSMLGKGTVTLSEAVFNLVFSTAGNIVGGAGLGLIHVFLNDARAQRAASGHPGTTRAELP